MASSNQKHRSNRHQLATIHASSIPIKHQACCGRSAMVCFRSVDMERCRKFPICPGAGSRADIAVKPNEKTLAYDGTVTAPSRGTFIVTGMRLPQIWATTSDGTSVWAGHRQVRQYLGVSAGRVRSTRRKPEQYNNRNAHNAASLHRRSSSSTRPVMSSTPGAGRDTSPVGQIPSTAFWSISKATFGSAAMGQAIELPTSSPRTASWLARSASNTLPTLRRRRIIRTPAFLVSPPSSRWMSGQTRSTSPTVI